MDGRAIFRPQGPEHVEKTHIAEGDDLPPGWFATRAEALHAASQGATIMVVEPVAGRVEQDLPLPQIKRRRGRPPKVSRA